MAQWIWKNTVERNEYVEFITNFEVSSAGKIKIDISAHSNYALYVNGELAGCGQYADYPFYKVFDSIDISAFTVSGKNTVAIICYYMGEFVATNYDMAPGLWFKVQDNKAVLAQSSSAVLCRKSFQYQGLNEFITPQLGYNYCRNMTKNDGWTEKNYIPSGFVCSTEYNLDYKLFSRPIKLLQMQPPKSGKIISRGLFMLNGGETAAQIMNRAKLFNISDESVNLGGTVLTTQTESGDGCYFLADLNGESAGYLNIEIEVGEPCDLMVGFGEHIADGRIRTEIEGRNFAYLYKLDKGKNVISEALRRTGARYLSAMVKTHKCSIKQLSLAEAVYPITEIPAKFSDSAMQKIYDVGVNTLKLCMHEHYEDCPWREQALYAMDSRNQMMFGYYVFKESEFAKASLRLLGLSLDQDGLVGLCAPSKCGITIPSFSLYWVLAMCEYVGHTADREFFNEMLPQITTVLNVFANRVTPSGLKTFGDKRYWNFHEWSCGLDGGTIFKQADGSERFDAILTFLAGYVFKKVYLITNNEDYAAVSKILRGSAKNFYCSDGFYCSFIEEDGTKVGKHVFTQSMALFCGCVVKTDILAEKLIKPNALTPCTIAALPFLYDGLMNCSAKYLKYILKNIEEIYTAMLSNGATSFYETEKGESDFNKAGSLCHGWASVPCYVYNKYYKH